MSNDNNRTEFERRTRAALRASAEHLNGATRSRLTQARHAALAQQQPRRSWFDLRVLAPAGALAAAVLVTALLVGQHGRMPQVNPSAGGALDDMELLADTDAYELTQETDLEFIEWAAAMGERDQVGG
jgi:hypothetical protein